MIISLSSFYHFSTPPQDIQELFFRRSLVLLLPVRFVGRRGSTDLKVNNFKISTASTKKTDKSKKQLFPKKQIKKSKPFWFALFYDKLAVCRTYFSSMPFSIFMTRTTSSIVISLCFFSSVFSAPLSVPVSLYTALPPTRPPLFCPAVFPACSPKHWRCSGSLYCCRYAAGSFHRTYFTSAPKNISILVQNIQTKIIFILFNIKNFIYYNNYSHYSTLVPLCKTFTLSLCKPSSSLGAHYASGFTTISVCAFFMILLLLRFA